MKKIAVINDLSGFGKCSLTAAIPVISANSAQACPLPTGVFSNQTGYDSFKSVDLTDSMQSFINEWKKLGVHFDGILTGFIPNFKQGEIISGFIDDFKEKNTVLLVDPVMGDDGEIYPCYDEKSVNAIKEIAKKADIITPNITELALLCSKDLKGEYSLDDIKDMSSSLGIKTVITTGIDLGDYIANAVCDGSEFKIIKSKKLGSHFSGTGDIFSSFVLSKYLSGEDIFTCVKDACDFIEKSIKETLKTAAPMSYHPDGIDFERFLDIKC